MPMRDTPLRVGINATALLSPRTGIGQYVYHLGRECLEAEDISPSFFYGTWKTQLRAQPLPNIDTIKTYIKKAVPWSYEIKSLIFQAQFSAGLLKHPVDVYHEPNYLAFRFSGPSVITVHDLSWIRHPETHPKQRLAAMSRYFPRSLERAAAILTDCSFVKKELVEMFGLNPERVTPVLLGVSPDFYPRDPSECNAFLAEHGLAHGQYVLSVGTLEPRKNIPALIDAYSMLPADLQQRFPLVLVGMRGWLTSGLEERMKPLVERGVIKPLGYVADEMMPLIYSGAAAFVFPSLYEGFGLPPLEAMACGAPVISSRSSSLPEVVGDAGILIDPLNVDELAESLRRVLEDRAFAEVLAQQGIKRAAGFSWKKTAAETIAVYRRALAA
jgi:glycosyltransferase involved in cell wall biosynthesis